MIARRTLARLLLLLALVLAAPASALRGQETPRRSWWQEVPERSSRYYRIRTDLPDDLARAYARHLDRMYEEYAQRLASLPPRIPERLNIYLFARQVDYLYTLRARFGIDGTGTGGMFFFNERGSGMAIWVEGLPDRRVHHVMQHEGFHQFAFSRFGTDLPMWANEGMAEFFGEAVLVGDTLVIGQATPRTVEAIKQSIRDDAYVPFRHMLAMSPHEWNENVKARSAGLQYQQAWSMVQFLVLGENGKYQEPFERYLRELNRAIPPDAAWRQVFGPDVEAFEAAWRAYAEAARPSAFMTALERIEFLAEGALALSRRGLSAESMESLRAQLREIDFAWERVGHAGRVVLRASDDANYLIPADDLSAEPAFVVEPPRGPRSARERLWEDRAPSPPRLSTDGLRPHGLSVDWRRDRDEGALAYELRVR